MAANKLNIGMLANVASDGNEGVSNQHVLTYVAANNSVEFKELNLSISGTGTVSSNADSVNTSTVSDINTVQDNVATTLTSLGTANTSIDTVEANLAAFATYANTNYASDAANSFATITVGEANVVASGTSNTLVFTSGNGISVTANADSQAITFDVNIGNVASEYYVLDGTANTVTLTKDNRPANTLYVTVGGLVQEPGINYITASTTLTLINTYPIINGTDVEVRYLPYTGEIAAPGVASLPAGMGTTSGYTLSGHDGNSRVTDIGKFSLSTDSGSADVGDLTDARTNLAGGSSPTHGYGLGGTNGINPNVPTMSVKMDKFSFSTDGSASNIGSLSRQYVGGSESMSTTHGYVHGHEISPAILVQGTTVDRYSFSSDANGTDNAELVAGRHSAAGHSSTTHGYTSAGSDPATNPTGINNIDKFSFANGGTGTDVGNLTIQITKAAGHHSGTHGYRSGGVGGPRVNSIDKFPFSSDTDATDVGELTASLSTARGINSTTHGYSIGGATDPAKVDVIQKFPFSSDTSASDVGELYQTLDGHSASVV